MTGKTTLKDLAKLLNLSISTVSKALNNSSEISELTRQKVKEAAISHNYTPNPLAQSLQGSNTKTIGVIIPDVLAHFFAKAMHGIETTANRYGYKVFICLSNETLEKEAESLKNLINGNVDGVIMSLSKETQSTGNYDHFKDTVKYDLPVVLFDRTSDSLPCDTICIDDMEAAKKAANYLLSTGCRKIIFLSTINGTSVGNRRESGYNEAMKAMDISPFSVYMESYSCFEETLMNVLKTREVDAVLAADELSAISVIKYALRHNYKIPEQLSVIGFTNGILAENFVPSLTTVEQHAEEQGAMAAEIMIKRIEKKLSKKNVQEILDTSIIERESTLNLQK